MNILILNAYCCADFTLEAGTAYEVSDTLGSYLIENLQIAKETKEKTHRTFELQIVPPEEIKTEEVKAKRKKTEK